jgi:hypothetical protein
MFNSLRMFKQENEYIEVDEDRSTPAPPSERIKSEPPMFQSSQDNPIVINEGPSFEDNSDVEFIEARVRTKKEPFDNIIVDMTMVRPNPHSPLNFLTNVEFQEDN